MKILIFLGKEKEEILSLLNDNIQYDVLFNVLGSRVGKGEEEFRKVDYTYVVNSCILCEKLNIENIIIYPIKIGIFFMLRIILNFCCIK